MKVEIWSDVMCPFCYIGKRRFEEALREFPARDDIQVEWKSFQLDPTLRKTTGKSVNEYLAERKGMTVDEARQLNDQVTRMAADVGLRYDFDKAIVAPSFDAHRLSHLAAAHGLGDQAEEALFKAYFTEGKDISDLETLIRLGQDIGLDAAEVRTTLEGDTYATSVRHDITEAAALGARGVPFFVLDRKYAVSGAQPTTTFAGALAQAHAEWAQQQPLQDIGEGDVCVPGEDCA